MPLAKAAPSGESPPPSTLGSSESFKSAPRRWKNTPTTTYGVFGETCPATAASQSLTALGTAASLWSESKALPPPPNGSAPMPKSTNSKKKLPGTEPSSSSFGFTSARKNNCIASTAENKPPTNEAKLPKKTGATANAGKTTKKRSTTWWLTPTPLWRLGN